MSTARSRLALAARVDAEGAREFARYFVSGGAALALQIAVLTALVEWLATPPVLASGVGFVLACVLNYTLQRCWVFRAAGAHRVLFARYAGVTTATLGLNLVLFWLTAEVIGIWYPLAQVLCTGAIFLLNFAINRAYTFAERAPEAEKT